MRYFQDAVGSVRALDDDAAAATDDDGDPVWIGADWSEITEAEALAIANPPPTLDEARAAKRREIDAAYSAELAVITDDYPEVERLTWDKQEREARAWAADNTAATPLLDAIASARGLTLSELVTRVIDKADAWVTASGAATGKRQALETAIAAATTVADVEAVTW